MAPGFINQFYEVSTVINYLWLLKYLYVKKMKMNIGSVSQDEGLIRFKKFFCFFGRSLITGKHMCTRSMRKGKCGWTPSIKLHWEYLCLLSLSTGGQRVLILLYILPHPPLVFNSRTFSTHPSTHLFHFFSFPVLPKKYFNWAAPMWDILPNIQKPPLPWTFCLLPF
jgi:hypothetical protein